MNKNIRLIFPSAVLAQGAEEAEYWNSNFEEDLLLKPLPQEEAYNELQVAHIQI